MNIEIKVQKRRNKKGNKKNNTKQDSLAAFKEQYTKIDIEIIEGVLKNNNYNYAKSNEILKNINNEVEIYHKENPYIEKQKEENYNIKDPPEVFNQQYIDILENDTEIDIKDKQNLFKLLKDINQDLKEKDPFGISKNELFNDIEFVNDMVI